MTDQQARDWHAIEGPNGMCHCGVYDDVVETCAGLLDREVRSPLQQQVAEKDAELLALRAAHAQLREAVQAAVNWYGLDGDGITEPTRSQLLAALAASPPHPETEGQ